MERPTPIGTPPEGAHHAPFFTIAMPAYNAEKTIGETLDSILGQSFDGWELIVVNDGSTDETSAIARRYAERDPRIRVIDQPNAGCGEARDVAIRASRSSWIVRFDADDVMLPTFLERIRAVISEKPGYEIISPTTWELLPDDQRRIWCPDPRYAREFELDFETALHGWVPVFGHSAFTRALYDRLGGLRPAMYAEDYDFWARALAAGAKGWFFPEPLSLYRVGGSEQMSATGAENTASYLTTLLDIAQTVDLGQDDEAMLRRRIGQLRRRVAFRRATVALLGERVSERVSRLIIAAVVRARRLQQRWRAR